MMARVQIRPNKYIDISDVQKTAILVVWLVAVARRTTETYGRKLRFIKLTEPGDP